jgi:hypothetical protein
MPAADTTADAAVQALFDAQPEARAEDCRTLSALMQRVSGHPARLWGRMVGFGSYHYVYESGREGDTFEIGFASGAGGKGDLTLYLHLNFDVTDSAPLLTRLGKHRLGKGCLYLKRLSDVDLAVLEDLCAAAVRQRRA